MCFKFLTIILIVLLLNINFNLKKYLKKILFLLFLCLHFNLFTQVDLYDIDFPYKGFVANIYEDKYGKIWIYNNTDYLRYTGDEFVKTNLTTEIGYTLISYKENLLFYENKNIIEYNLKTKKTTVLYQLDKNTLLDFYYKDDAQKIWIFTKNKTDKTRFVYQLEEDKTIAFAFDLYPYLKDKPIDVDKNIADADGLFYFNFITEKLLLLNHKGVLVKLPIKEKNNCAIFKLDNKNNLWRISNDLFEIYNTKTKTFEKHPISSKIIVKNNCQFKPGFSLILHTIFIDSTNKIWLGFEDSNLFVFDKKDDSFINFKIPLIKTLEGKSGDIKKIIEDKNGNIWGNKRGGIFKIRKKENYFKSYLINTDNPNHQLYKLNARHTEKIWALFGKESLKTFPIKPIIDEKGNIYTQDQRFSYKISSETNTLEIIPWLHKKSNQYLHSIDNSLKIHTTWDAYYTLDKNLKETLVKQPNNLKIKSLQQVYKQKNGNIWASGILGNEKRFIAKLDPNTFEIAEIYKNDTYNFEDIKTNKFEEDEFGNLLISTSEGLFILDEKNQLKKTPKYKLYKKDSIAFKNAFTEFDVLKNNKGWLHNRFQIGQLDLKTNQLKYYVTNDALNQIEFYDILPINEHSIWYGSNYGLGFYNFKTQENIHFDETFTLIEDFKVQSLTKNPITKEIIATSTNGLHIFHPDSLLKKHNFKKNINKNVPLEFTNYSYLLDRENEIKTYNYENNKQITINYDDKLLQFNFEIIHYSFPKRHVFKYFLEGYDTHWSKESNNRSITYTSLPPGNYTLKIKGSIGNNVWSKNELTIPIKVKEAWFRTGWFYFTLITFLTLIITQITRFYYRLKINQQQEIETLRTKISADLHDDVGSILTGLSMQTEILEHQSSGAQKEKLSKISNLSRAAMLRMRDAVWAMDTRKNNWKSLIDRMNEFAAETLELKDIAYQIKFEETAINETLNTIVRQNLYLIYKEAVTNILKHSNATKVLINLTKENTFFEMEIRDNGTLKEEITAAGLGLSNIKLRAKEINASATISQKNGFAIKITSKPH